MAASQYASRSDLEGLGLPRTALKNVENGTIDDILIAASGFVDSHLRGRYSLPLQNPFPPEIATATVDIGALRVLRRRGYNPDEFDESWKEAHDAAVTWLKDVAAGRVHLAIAADATPTTSEGAPRVQTQPARGW